MTDQRLLNAQMWNAIESVRNRDTGTNGEDALKALTIALNLGANPDAIYVNENGERPYGNQTPLSYITEHMSHKSPKFQYQERMAALLINRGANVNFRSESGFMPLMAATNADSFNTVKLLLDKGADVNAIWGYDSDNRTALGFAYQPAIMKLLLEHGADPNRGSSRDGFYPLHDVCFGIHYATKKESIEAHLSRIKMLLEYGANPNAYTLDIYTPMMMICGAGMEEKKNSISSDVKLAAIKLLFEYGANIDADHYRITALGFAAESEDWPVVEALAFNGASIYRDVVPPMSKEKSERVWAKLRQIIDKTLEWERQEEERQRQEKLKEKMTWKTSPAQKMADLQQGQKIVEAMGKPKIGNIHKLDKRSM